MSTTDRSVLHHKDQITLKASPQEVWDAIKKFDSIHTWHPAAVSTEILVGENGKPLTVREFQTIDGGFVISELLAYGETKMWFKYRIIKASVPLRGYVGEMQVVPADGGGSVVLWPAQFQRPDETPKPGEDDRATEKLVQGIFTAGLNNLPVVISG
jgi:hypothetical protein